MRRFALALGVQPLVVAAAETLNDLEGSQIQRLVPHVEQRVSRIGIVLVRGRACVRALAPAVACAVVSTHSEDVSNPPAPGSPNLDRNLNLETRHLWARQRILVAAGATQLWSTRRSNVRDWRLAQARVHVHLSLLPVLVPALVSFLA